MEEGRPVLVISYLLTDLWKFPMYSRCHLSFGDFMWLEISSSILRVVLLFVTFFATRNIYISLYTCVTQFVVLFSH